MKILAPALIAAVVLVSCASPKVDPTTILISDFSDVAPNVGKRVTVVGYVSLTQEAAGIYFSWRDMARENDRCIRPPNLSRMRHGAKVSLTGVLERSDCGEGTICLNTCDDYLLFETGDSERISP